MGIVDTVKIIKKAQVCDIVMVKIGKFVYTYGKDAYIMSFLFKYKTKLIENNIYVCGFPKDQINKIMATLENKKINYLILDKRNSYRVDEESNNKNLNKYNDYLEKSIRYVKRKRQIDDIYNILLSNIDNAEIEQTITSIKRVINERRKI